MSALRTRLRRRELSQRLSAGEALRTRPLSALLIRVSSRAGICVSSAAMAHWTAAEGGTLKRTVLDLAAGSAATVIRSSPDGTRAARLAEFGIVCGSLISVLALRPAPVIACGSSIVAVDDEIAGEIEVE